MKMNGKGERRKKRGICRRMEGGGEKIKKEKEERTEVGKEKEKGNLT